MGSFLQGLEHGGANVLQAALTALGPAIIAAVGGASGGAAPIVVPIATSLVTGIINAEKAHVNAQVTQAAQVSAQNNVPVVAAAQPGISGADKKAMVLSHLQFAMPLIEALAAQAGFPIADPVAFQIALGPVIDSTVNVINAYSVLIGAIRPKTA